MIDLNIIHSIDDCTILNSIAIKIPSGLSFLSNGKAALKNENTHKINILFEHMQVKGLIPHRFVPDNFDNSTIKVIKKLLKFNNIQENTVGSQMLKTSIAQSYKNFTSKLSKFETILKNEDSIGDIKKTFQNNERTLIKAQKDRYTNIPEPDDLSIIGGLINFSGQSVKKIIITQDEHFWGYDDLIEDIWNIKIIKEWECDQLIQ